MLTNVSLPIRHGWLLRRFDLCHAIQGGEKVRPRLALLGQDLLARSRQLVIPATALTGFLDPAAFNQSSFFHSIQQWIERRDVELQNAVGSLLDQFRDLVPMARPF